MKKVFPRSMVAHVWANESQEEGKTGNGSLYFTGDTIYSYGSHFPIARHVHRQGKHVVLMTTRTYSATTDKQIHMVRAACGHIDVFNVPNVLADTPAARRTNLDAYRERLVYLMQSYGKARTRKPGIFDDIRKTVDEANEYAAFFGIRSRLKMPANAEELSAECANIEHLENVKRKRDAAKLAKEVAARKVRVAELFRQWREGEDVEVPWGESEIALRIARNPFGGEDILQTSRGAEVPLPHALKAFRFIKATRDSGVAWERNGQEIRLGAFHVDRIDADGTVHAGCHTVAYSEIERVAELAGAMQEPAAVA